MKPSIQQFTKGIVINVFVFLGILGSPAYAQAATNLLTNANFASGGTGWMTAITAPTVGSIKFTTGTGLFAIDVAGTANYQAQLYQLISVTAGKTYDYSFTAKKSSAGTRNIDFVVEGNVNPYSKDLVRTISIDGTAKTYSGTFTATASRAVRIEIQGGLSDLDFEVDNFVVSLKSTADTAAPAISGLAATPQYDTTSTRALNFSASDNVGVTGYLVTVGDDSFIGYDTTIPALPSLADSRWTATKPTEVAFESNKGTGIYKVWVYAKDAAGNIGSATTSYTQGDSYENDDTPALAKAVVINDEHQYRNSHAAGYDVGPNPDWAKFSVVAGQTYTITVNHDEVPIGMGSVIKLYTSSDWVNPVATQEETNEPGQPYQLTANSITFTAAYTGNYYVLCLGRPVARYPQQENYQLSVTTPTNPDTIAPRIRHFLVNEVESTSNTRTLFINASDNTEIAEYAITTGPGCFWCYNVPPAPADGDPVWTPIKPTSVTVPTAVGGVYVYLYVKDRAGNIASAGTLFYFWDAYEQDDWSDSGKEVVVNAAPQNRTSHGNMNLDWAYFNAVAGTTYKVSVVHTTPMTYNPSTLRVYPYTAVAPDENAVPLQEISETDYTNPSPMEITFTPTTTGMYYLRYQGRNGYKDNIYETYTLAVTSAAPSNLILNGAFTNAGTSWTPKITAPATGSFTYTTGTAKFNINTASTINADFQLSQKINIVGGKKYNYSFYAKKLNAGTRNISFLVVSDLTPFTRDVDRQVAIDGNGATFTGSFTASSSRAVNISFRGGLSDLDFEVDNVVITAAP